MIAVVPIGVGALHVGHQKLYGGPDGGDGAGLQKLHVVGVAIVPPQALDGPGRLADFPTPGRYRVGHHIHRGGVGRMRVVGPRQLVIFLGPLPTYRQNLVNHVDIRQMFVDMITTKAEPKRLLGVVVHVVVAMPGRANGEVTPIGK